MKVKKYTAKSMHEAMKLIRAELGDDAVILNSKEVDIGGFLGFFTKKQLEVIAAVDPSINRPSSRGIQPRPRVETNLPNRRKIKDNPDTEQTKELMNELTQLKKMIQGMNEKDETNVKDYPEPFQQIDDRLRLQGVSESIRLDIMKHLLKAWYNQEGHDKNLEEIEEQLHDYLLKLLSPYEMGGLTFDKKVVNIVGPTGVGKTTTIAKIAAHCVLKKHKKVALITTDTYRIAAVEQLKTYAKILNIPLEVAYSIDDFKKAAKQFEHYDLILVDSAGRNFRNRLYVEELSKVIDFENEANTYLVLSLTSKYEDMKEILNQFSLIPIRKIILTKKDETSTFGVMINVPIELGKGIAYVTNGQNVPDDIVEATAPYILKSVLEVD
ncbi:flagellar biosynthesis protein FlhF [Halalkalibacter urbisdiaboli]|uniref:flagellar biosynthesis protein FlhF n=1 Tax=Halalkalibacter urbisdiaboli TaxID=1960589 RepID=UPI000B436FFA|nr:flagellar biosynthesis protein FlhF [Halalkalibacter urbisdiaboli]